MTINGDWIIMLSLKNDGKAPHSYYKSGQDKAVRINRFLLIIHVYSCTHRHAHTLNKDLRHTHAMIND